MLDEGIPYLFLEQSFTPPTFFQEEKPVPVISHLKKGRVSEDSEYSLGEYYSPRDITVANVTEKYDVLKNPRKEISYKIKKWISK